MRTSRKYVNPSINGSRNIFTSYDEIPDSINLTPAVLPSLNVENFTNTVTFTGLTVPVFLRLTGSAGVYHSSSYLNVYKNNILVQIINTPFSFPLTNLIEPFYLNDTLKVGYYSSSDISYTLNIFRFRYSILNPLTVVSPSIDTCDINISGLP